MSSRKNSNQWFSFSMIVVLLISLSIITLSPSFLSNNKISAIELSSNHSKDMESSETEKDLNEEPINIFCSELSKARFQNPSFDLKRIHTVFLVPRVFYDVRILPPESLIG